MPDKSLLVSIGMPLYNEERYLRQTLDSLISQDYGNFELIISDNGSVDGTSHICQEYAAKDRRVHYYRNETNIGAAVNFQRVFELAQGDYFVWVAGHDLWHQTFLSRCLEILSQDASIVLCYPQALWINTDGHPLGLIPSSVETRGLNRISRLNVVLWGLGYCYPVYGLISSQALRKVSLGLQVIATDAIILTELSLLGAFAHISEPLLYIRKMDDFGSWEKYVEKIFMQSLSDLSPPCLYWQMIDEHLKVVSKHIGPSLEKDAATLSTLLCLLTKYSWVLNGIQDSKGELQSSKSDVEERINQLGSQIHDMAMSVEKQFIDDKLDANQKVFPKILIDGVFFQLYRTGIARVWNSLLEKWAENSFGNHIIVLDRAGTVPKIAGIRYLTIPAYNYETTDADREMLQQVCDEVEADLFISTYYTTPIATTSVFMAYDMLPEVWGANLDKPMWREKHRAINHASAYIAISQNTASDLVKFFPNIALESIAVAHCGVASSFSPANQEEISYFKTKYGIFKPYFLVVGAGDVHKNTDLFFQAFGQLPTKQAFDIVCTGKRFPFKDEFREYTSGSAVHILELSDSELSVAYSGAVALVYPSKYEGFGLPVLEAIACGCPVITCLNASIPEVAGKAALYVSDTDVNELAKALCEVQKPDVRRALIAEGLEQAKKFSWSKMARIVSTALIDAAFQALKLRKINLIIFPDWSASEESIGTDLTKAIRAIATHPDRMKITLLLDTANISEEEANLTLSGVAMNLLMEEDLDITESAEISLVGNLEQRQWDILLGRIQAKLALENENEQAIAAVKAESLPDCELDSFTSRRAVQSKEGDWKFIFPELESLTDTQTENDFQEQSPVDCYLEYIKTNCPTLDLNTQLRVKSSLESTSWDNPVSAADLNNFAVVALIEAERCPDLSVKELYFNMALEALNRGVELREHPLCTAHLAVVLAMTGEILESSQVSLASFIDTLHYADSSVNKILPAIVYLPANDNSLRSYRNENITQIIQAEEGYTQAVMLLTEVLCRSLLVSYNSRGLFIQNLASQVFPDSISINLTLGVSSLINNLWEGLLYLHRARQKAPDSAPILQALYLAYKNLEQTEKANYWLNHARDLCNNRPHSLEWRWTELNLESYFTYVPFEGQMLLAVESNFQSYATGVLISEGDWFEKEMEFWRNSIQPGMTIIDVGANVGVYTFSAARRVGSRGRVLAVEPFSSCVRCLQESCKIGNFDWVKVCAGAASDREGKARLSLSLASELNKIVVGESAEKMEPGTFEDVTCFTLDSLIERENLTTVDFLKIDAEGHELSVLTGSDKILSEFSPTILYENTDVGQRSNLAAADYLRGRGYRLFIYQPYLQKLLPVESAEDLQGNLNVIALPSHLNDLQSLNLS